MRGQPLTKAGNDENDTAGSREGRGPSGEFHEKIRRIASIVEHIHNQTVIKRIDDGLMSYNDKAERADSHG